MASFYFRDRARIGWYRTYHLNGKTLSIDRKVGRKVISDVIDLSSAAPHSTRARLMNAGAINRSLAGLVVIVALACIGTLLFAIPFVHVLLRYLSPVDVEQFRSEKGALLFDVMYSKRHATEIDEFIAALHAAIKSEQPNQSTDPTPASGTPPAGQESRHP